MKKLYKYSINMDRATAFTIHSGFEVLDIQIQCNTTVMWCIVDIDNPKVKITIDVFGTGEDLPLGSSKSNYIKTLQYQDGRYIAHFFLTISE